MPGDGPDHTVSQDQDKAGADPQLSSLFLGSLCSPSCLWEMGILKPHSSSASMLLSHSFHKHPAGLLCPFHAGHWGRGKRQLLGTAGACECLNPIPLWSPQL